ncbi:protein cycle [Atheta coriaria]|uniref:protein cycle n=1 Tax=Dalotia coriaria TaxID=877792 RepID=UPI0031F36605
MVARNFSVQELPYSRLLQVNADERRDYMTLEELKPVTVQNIQPHQPSYQASYYELSSMVEHPCSSSLYQNDQQATDLDTIESTISDVHNLQNPVSRKRKSSYNDPNDFEDDASGNMKTSKSVDENKKQNHSEIEKRRRDKMNTYITELSSIVPMCHAMSRKLDKLTVLRMAVQHLKTIRGAVNSYTEGHYKPSFLSDQELKHLILQAADGFLFVVGCDRGRILYVSESVSKVLNYSQGDLLGQSMFDILHPKDVAKVKEQLSSSDLNPRERLIDAKTMLPVKTDLPPGVSRMCPGARRSFFCRMKCKISAQVKEEADTTTGCHRRKNKQSSDKKFNVIQCTGYLKSWAPAKIGVEEHEGEGDSFNLSCLVAVGRILPKISTVAPSTQVRPNVKNVQFISRHALDGKFLFVDQRATLVLGFLPQELLGTSMYEYYHNDDIQTLSEYHKTALQNNERVNTKIYRFRTKDDGFVRLQSEWKAFKNPWTKEIECVIAKNSLILTDLRTVESTGERTENIRENFEFFTQNSGKEIQRIIHDHVEASNIGRHVAEQVLDTQSSQRQEGDTPEESSPNSEPESSLQNLQANESQISTSVPCPGMSTSDQNQMISNYQPQDSQFNNHHVQNNISLTNLSEPGGSVVTLPASESRVIGMMEDAVRESPTNNPSSDGNDEAAMAVIMSLLEADAGLGGPVDFSGLPWPLP